MPGGRSARQHAIYSNSCPCSSLYPFERLEGKKKAEANRASALNAFAPAFVVDKSNVLGYTARAVKKRLRKKYHVGEFREIGFYFTIRVQDGDSLSSSGVKLLTALDEECIRPNGLDCTLVQGEEGDFFVAWDAHTARTTEAQVRAVRDWLGARADVEKFAVSELCDLWHDPIG